MCEYPEKVSLLKGLLALSSTFMVPFHVHAATQPSYAVAEAQRIEVLESPVSIEWRGVILYDYLQGIEKISDDGEEINFYAPVGEFASALDITVTDSTSTAVAGWIGEPKNSWYISKDYISSKGKRISVKELDLVSWNGELFASVSVLKEAMGFGITLNESERIITVDSQADIPMLLSMRRTETRKLLAWNKANKEIEEEKDKLTPFHVDPYAIVSMPVLDTSFSFSQGHGKQSTGIAYYGNVQNQMFYMDSSITFSGSIMSRANVDPNISLNSFVLSRDFTTKQGDTLSLSLGDVSFSGPTSPAATVGGGRGVSFYKRYAGQLGPMEASSRVLYRGMGTPGDDIEVYRGKDELVYSSVIPEDGIYEIPKQTLFAGVNTFYIREYNAGGLVREVVVRRTISQSQLAAGKSSYGVALLQPNSFMRDIVKKDDKKSSKDQRAGLSFVYAVGLTDNLTTTFGYSYIPVKKNEKEDYISVFGNTSTFSLGTASVSVNMDTYLRGASNALTLSASTSMPIGETVSVSAGHTNYVNSDAEEMFRKKSVSNASISFSLGKSTSVSYRAAFERSLLDTYNLNTSVFGSTKLGPLNLSSSFSANLPQGGADQATYRGSVASSISSSGIVLSGQVGYGKKPEKEWKVRNYNLRAYLPGMRKRWGISTRLSYDPNPDVVGLSLGFAKTFDVLRLSTSLQTKSNKTYSIGVSVGTSLSYIPDNGFVVSGTRAPNRIIVPEYFIDSNGNNVRDPGEKPLKGIKTLISGGSFASDKASGESGKGFLIRSMKTNQPFTVTVDRSSLKDPFLTAKEKGYQVNSPAPAGEKLVIPIPMVRVSDVEVFVYERKGLEDSPVSRMIFELYQGKERIKRIRSMSGGELYFENLTPGDYVLKVADRQFGSAAGYTTEDVKFTVSGEEIQIKQVKVRVQKKSD